MALIDTLAGSSPAPLSRPNFNNGALYSASNGGLMGGGEMDNLYRQLLLGWQQNQQPIADDMTRNMMNSMIAQGGAGSINSSQGRQNFTGLRQRLLDAVLTQAGGSLQRASSGPRINPNQMPQAGQQGPSGNFNKFGSDPMFMGQPQPYQSTWGSYAAAPNAGFNSVGGPTNNAYGGGFHGIGEMGMGETGGPIDYAAVAEQQRQTAEQQAQKYAGYADPYGGFYDSMGSYNAYGADGSAFTDNGMTGYDPPNSGGGGDWSGGMGDVPQAPDAPVDYSMFF